MPDVNVPFEYEYGVTEADEARVAAKKKKIRDLRVELELYNFLITHHTRPYSISWYKYKWWMFEAAVNLAWAQRDALDEALNMPAIWTRPITRAQREAGRLPRCRSLPCLVSPDTIP